MTAVRGLGLLLAADLDRPAAEVVDGCREHGLLITSAGDRTLRLTPPLTVTDDEIRLALGLFEEAVS